VKKKKKSFLRKYFLVFIILSVLPFSAKAFTPPASLFGEVKNKIKTDKKVVALTFDDGPNKVYTRQILAVLGKKGIRATFFLTGLNIFGNEGLVRMMVRKGHVVGNHSYSHKNLTLVMPETVRVEVEKSERLGEEIAGVSYKLFRAPYGFYNNPYLMNYLADNGYVVIGWSVDPADWKNQDVGHIVNDVLTNVDNGAIILLHDGPENFGKSGEGIDRSATVEATGIIIDKLRKRGFRFLTLPELLELDESEGRKVLGVEK